MRNKRCNCKVSKRRGVSIDVFDAVRTVLAVRQFQDRPIPEPIVRKIVEAAHLTASSRNGQPWHFIVVQDKDKLRALRVISHEQASR